MILGDILSKSTDPYERKARLAPALLALMPLVALSIGQYGVTLDWSDGAWGLLVSIGVFYLLASITREYGKRLEPDLYREWGGIPTTQLQRHRDCTIDVVTKARYHRFLEGQLGLTYPTASAEAEDAASADQLYAAGTRWLLNQTRNQEQFPLLFKENVAYGFRRNALGIKWIALFIAFGALAWTLFSTGVLSATGISLQKLTNATPAINLLMIIELACIAVWSFFVTPTTVRTAAFSYADQLLRCCDSLASQAWMADRPG